LKALLFAIFFLLMAMPIFAQNNVTTRVFAKTGTSIEFYFNQLQDYNNGLSLENFTILQIEYNDTIAGGIANGAGPGWELNVRADNNFLESNSGATLPLDVVELRVDLDGSVTTHTLTSIDNEILSGLDKVNYVNDVIISYDIGKTNPIDVISNETFWVELVFTIKTKD
jgi:hypothetical protein